MNLIIYGSTMIIQMNLYNFDKFGPFHTFLSITKFNIPLKVPHLLALGHKCVCFEVLETSKEGK